MSDQVATKLPAPSTATDGTPADRYWLSIVGAPKFCAAAGAASVTDSAAAHAAMTLPPVCRACWAIFISVPDERWCLRENDVGPQHSRTIHTIRQHFQQGRRGCLSLTARGGDRRVDSFRVGDGDAILSCNVGGTHADLRVAPSHRAV